MLEKAEYLLKPADGFQSDEAGIFFAQLEDQTERLFDKIRDITPEELEWQPAPGINTAGMLLAHFAIAEVGYAQYAFLQTENVDVAQVLGCDRTYSGLPLPPDGRPPAHLSGKSLAEYRELLAKARAYYRECSAKLSNADMDRLIKGKRSVSIRWAMYHIVEHFATHAGQILLLRHLYALENRGSAKSA